MYQPNIKNHLYSLKYSVLLLASLLAGCGGSSGDSTPEINLAPVASKVSITDNNGGSPVVGDGLTGNYIYTDFEGDVEGATSFRWLRNGVAISDAATTTYSLTASDSGQSISFEVIPVASTGTTTGSAVTSSTITVINSAPIASSVSIVDDNGGNALVGDGLTGSYSYADVDGDDEGISTYSWLRNGVAIGGQTSLNYTLVLADRGQSIAFKVTPVAVVGATIGNAVSSVPITVLNNAPVANAGPDQTLVVGSLVSLDGSGSFDTDGDSLIYSWSFVSKPIGSLAVLSDFMSIIPSFTADVSGEYVLSLVVNDGDLDSVTDTVVITVGSGYASSGSINGFGSVFVNGVEFDTASATFDIDRTSGAQDDLAIGMIVKVNGTINSDGITGAATSISFDDQLQGPVTGLTPPDADGIMRSFVVLGVNVIVDISSTTFDISSNVIPVGPFDFDSIANSNNVEISGFFDASGNLIATRVELKDIFFTPATSIVEIEGTITGLSGTAFTIGILTVDASAATIDDLPNGLVDGQYVEVNGALDAGLTILTASRVEGEDNSIADTDGFELEGVITNYVDDSNFMISGTSVDASNAIREPAALILADNVRVEAEGAVVNGIILATEVNLEGGDLKVHAMVTSVDVATSTFKVSPIVGQPEIMVTVTTGTQLEDNVNNIEQFTLNNFITGVHFVDVRGFDDGNGGITATEIDVKEPGDVIVQGNLQVFNADVLIQVIGVTFTVDYSGGTGETKFENTTDTVITQSEFIITAPVDTLVKIRDVKNSGVLGVADEIDIEIPGALNFPSIGSQVGQQSPDFSLFDTLGNIRGLYDELSKSTGVVLYFTMWTPINDVHASHMRAEVMPNFPEVSFFLVDYVTGSVIDSRTAQLANGYGDIETLADINQTVFNLYQASMGTTIVIDNAGIVRMNEDYLDGTKLTDVLTNLK